MSVLATCKFDEDPIKIEVIIDRTRSNIWAFSDLKGKLLLSEKSDLAEIQLIREFMAVPVTCKFDEDPIGQGQIWAFSALKGKYLYGNSLMWLEVELIQDFMAVLVICKIDKDWIKGEVAIDWTKLSPL